LHEDYYSLSFFGKMTAVKPAFVTCFVSFVALVTGVVLS